MRFKLLRNYQDYFRFRRNVHDNLDVAKNLLPAASQRKHKYVRGSGEAEPRVKNVYP